MGILYIGPDFRGQRVLQALSAHQVLEPVRFPGALVTVVPSSPKVPKESIKPNYDAEAKRTDHEPKKTPDILLL